jgi:alpha-L-fucosidase
MLIDVSSTGGNFLLNVGPDASGNLPPLQLECLQGLAAWMEMNSAGIHDTEPVPENIASPIGLGPKPSSGPWVRWNRRGHDLFCFVEGTGDLVLPVNRDAVDLASCELLNDEKVAIEADGLVHLDELTFYDAPVCLRFKLRK